jgi:DNA-binding transcriptional LysR family regulator
MNASLAIADIDPFSSKINIYHYLCFVSVAEELSFTRAARRLQMDQSWLSAKIRHLEQALKLKLFERTTRHVELTEAGLRLIPSAQRMAEAFTETLEVSLALSKCLEGKLCIGLPPYSFRHRLMDEALNTFGRENAQVVVHAITNKSSAALSNLLRAGEVDVMVGTFPFDMDGLEVVTLREERCSLVIPADERLANLPELKMADLAGRTIVTFPEELNPSLHAYAYAPLRQAGATLKSCPETYQSSLMRLASQIGGFAATTPNDLSGLPNFVVRQISDSPPLRRTIARRVDSSSAIVDRFWTLAVRMCRSTRPAPPKTAVNRRELEPVSVLGECSARSTFAVRSLPSCSD